VFVLQLLQLLLLLLMLSMLSLLLLRLDDALSAAIILIGRRRHRLATIIKRVQLYVLRFARPVVILVVVIVAAAPVVAAVAVSAAADADAAPGPDSVDGARRVRR